MQTKSKVFPGAKADSQIIFMVADPSCAVENHQSGLIIDMWLTGQRSSYYDRAGEFHPVNGVMIRYLGIEAPGALNLFFAEKPAELEATFSRLHELPDNGVDLSMEQPLFKCWIDQPGRGGTGHSNLVLARQIIRG